MINWKLTDFIEPSWTNPDDFLTKYKDKFQDLRSFSNSLKQYSQTLKDQLTTIIHDDYTEFVSISKQLIQLGDTISELLKSLRTSEKAVAAAASQLEESTLPIKSQADKLYNVRHEYAVLSLALEAIERLQMIESQLNQTDLNIYKFLDISIGFAVTMAKLTGLDQPSERKTIEAEYAILYKSFQNKLKMKFLELLENRRKEELLIIFNSAILSGLETFLEVTFSEKIKKELLDPLNNKRSQIMGNSIDVLTLFIKYVEDESNDFNYLFSISPNIFDFTLNSLWHTLSQWMDSYLSFPLGNQEGQKKSFELLSQFLGICEHKCTSVESVLAIRNSPVTERIMAKLRLDLYTQIISNQILTETDKLFNEPLKADGSQYFLSFTEKFIEVYSNVYKPELFIPEQSKDFAIISMKMIASLINFANKASFAHQPFFVADFQKLGPELLTLTPDFMRNAMKIATNSLETTSQQLQTQLIETISNNCNKHLSYIQELTGFDSKTITTTKGAIQTINTYLDWEKSSRNACSTIAFFTDVLKNILNCFYKLSAEQLETLKGRQKVLMKIKQTHTPQSTKSESKRNYFSPEAAQKQLKHDIEYICNVARERGVDVESLVDSQNQPLYKMIQELLTKDLLENSS